MAGSRERESESRVGYVKRFKTGQSRRKIVQKAIYTLVYTYVCCVLPVYIRSEREGRKGEKKGV